MALALNSFLPWLDASRVLRLAASGFRELNFDARCPTGVRGTPPHIEVVASGPDGVVGVTVRVFDYLGPRPSSCRPPTPRLRVPEALEPWAAWRASARGAALSAMSTCRPRQARHRPRADLPAPARQAALPVPGAAAAGAASSPSIGPSSRGWPSARGAARWRLPPSASTSSGRPGAARTRPAGCARSPLSWHAVMRVAMPR